jgi:hypothetical protein
MLFSFPDASFTPPIRHLRRRAGPAAGDPSRWRPISNNRIVGCLIQVFLHCGARISVGPCSVDVHAQFQPLSPALLWIDPIRCFDQRSTILGDQGPAPTTGRRRAPLGSRSWLSKRFPWAVVPRAVSMVPGDPNGFLKRRDRREDDRRQKGRSLSAESDGSSREGPMQASGLPSAAIPPIALRVSGPDSISGAPPPTPAPGPRAIRMADCTRARSRPTASRIGIPASPQRSCCNNCAVFAHAICEQHGGRLHPATATAASLVPYDRFAQRASSPK